MDLLLFYLLLVELVPFSKIKYTNSAQLNTIQYYEGFNVDPYT